MINEKYYFVNTNVNIKYPTLWDGYLNYTKNSSDVVINYLDIDNILVDICEINFYIHLQPETIYISLDRDENYYFHQFEKHIKPVIKKMEEIMNITIQYGEFNASEIKHDPNLFKYIITRKTDKIILQKQSLNWSILHKNDNTSDLSAKLNNMNINK